jgi:phosphate transport system permease protein
MQAEAQTPKVPARLIEEAPARKSRPSVTPLGTGLRTPRSHRIAEGAIRAIAFLSILAIVSIFVVIAKEALPLFFEPEAQEELSGLASLFVPRQWAGHDEAIFMWQPVGDVGKFNIVPLFVGTLKITALGMLFATPAAVLAAVFVSMYAGARWREILKPIIELLASVPSVVIGFFALMILASLTQDLFGFTYRLNAFVAGLGLAIAIAPVIFTVSEDALSSVPKDLEAAALALGARKYQVVLRVALPAAIPGIAAAMILGFGRAIGETMVVLMASGNAAVMEVFDPSTSARTVTATIASELGEVGHGDPHWRVLFLLGSLLFVVTFVLNRGAVVIVDRLHRKLTAGGRP